MKRDNNRNDSYNITIKMKNNEIQSIDNNCVKNRGNTLSVSFYIPEDSR
jgi:hypothetical protein